MGVDYLLDRLVTAHVDDNQFSVRVNGGHPVVKQDDGGDPGVIGSTASSNASSHPTPSDRRVRGGEDRVWPVMASYA